jgi:hypothetical protein
MTEPNTLPENVKSETIEFHDAKGFPTEDRKVAVSAEVTTTYKDGRVEHSLLRLTPKAK